MLDFVKHRAFTAVVVVALSGMPAVAAACAALCMPAMTSPHAHCHDADVPVKLSAAPPGCCQLDRAPAAPVATTPGVFTVAPPASSSTVVAVANPRVTDLASLIDQSHGPPIRLVSIPLPLRI